jgi:hypothetical protein
MRAFRISRGALSPLSLGVHLCLLAMILLAYIYIRETYSWTNRYFTIRDFAGVDFPKGHVQTHIEGGAVFAHFQTDSDGLSSFLHESGFDSPETGCWLFTITPPSPPNWWREECGPGDVSHVADRHGGVCRQVLIAEGSETVDVYLAAALCDNP